MGKNMKLDPNITSTRPELELSVQMPGAYIIRDGVSVPDLNDEAMAQRVKNAERKAASHAEPVEADEKADETDK